MKLAPSPFESDNDQAARLRGRYADLREQLEALLAQPEKDMSAIDRLVDDLEHCQLEVKAALGVKGNNPNE